MKKLIIFLPLLFCCSCAAADALFGTGSGGETTEKTVGVLTSLLAMFGGPTGIAVGGLITTALSIGKNTYQNKQNKSKIQLAEDAFSDVVIGLETAKKVLPKEQLDKLHKKLSDTIPESLKPLILSIRAGK